jgi:hypothetical protein
MKINSEYMAVDVFWRHYYIAEISWETDWDHIKSQGQQTAYRLKNWTQNPSDTKLRLLSIIGYIEVSVWLYPSLRWRQTVSQDGQLQRKFKDWINISSDQFNKLSRNLSGGATVQIAVYWDVTPCRLTYSIRLLLWRLTHQVTTKPRYLPTKDYGVTSHATITLSR